MIHTDFEKDFLNAKTMKYDELIKNESNLMKKIGEKTVLNEMLFK